MDSTTYVTILKDTLVKKNSLLDKIIKVLEFQEECIENPKMNVEQFDKTLLEKETYIKQLSQLDDGFEKLYLRVKEDLTTKKEMFKEDILYIQELIKEITAKSAKIQIKEKQIKVKFESFLVSKKKEIREYKVNTQTISSYYKNMANSYQGESYFLDKKN